MDNQSAQLTNLAKQLSQKKLQDFMSSMAQSPLAGIAKGYMGDYNPENTTSGFQTGQALQFSPIGIGAVGIKGALGALREAPVVGKAIQESGMIAKAAKPISALDAFLKQEELNQVPKFADKLAKEDIPVVQQALNQLMGCIS